MTKSILKISNTQIFSSSSWFVIIYYVISSFTNSCTQVLKLIHSLRWDVVVRVCLDIGGYIDHPCLNFLFIMSFSISNWTFFYLLFLSSRSQSLFNTSTFLCLFQARIWNSTAIVLVVLLFTNLGRGVVLLILVKSLTSLLNVLFIIEYLWKESLNSDGQ
jgi:hypothetical protein